MAHLLDTDIVIDYLAGDTTTKNLVAPFIRSGAALSLITYMEVLQGILESSDPAAARKEFDAFLAAVPVVPFSLAIADRCATLRMELKRQGKRVRPRALDLITAATALEHRLILVTRNKVDYGDVPGLTLH